MPRFKLNVAFLLELVAVLAVALWQVQLYHYQGLYDPEQNPPDDVLVYRPCVWR